MKGQIKYNVNIYIMANKFDKLQQSYIQKYKDLIMQDMYTYLIENRLDGFEPPTPENCMIAIDAVYKRHTEVVELDIKPSDKSKSSNDYTLLFDRIFSLDEIHGLNEIPGLRDIIIPYAISYGKSINSGYIGVVAMVIWGIQNRGAAFSYTEPSAGLQPHPPYLPPSLPKSSASASGRQFDRSKLQKKVPYSEEKKQF